MPAHRPTLCARTGFTLLEVLIALVLVVLLTGLVGVSVQPLLRAGAEREARAQLLGAVSLAHQHARRLGEPVRLVARHDAGDRTRIVLMAWDTLSDDPFASPTRDAPVGEIGEIDVGRIAFDEDAPSARGDRPSFDREFSGRVLLELPAGFRVVRPTRAQREGGLARLAQSDDAGVSFSGASSEEGFFPIEADRVTIAIFLPDGSAIVGDPPLVRTPSRALLELHINPWTARGELRELRMDDEVGEGSGMTDAPGGDGDIGTPFDPGVESDGGRP